MHWRRRHTRDQLTDEVLQAHGLSHIVFCEGCDNGYVDLEQHLRGKCQGANESSRTSYGEWGIDDRCVSEESAAETVAGSEAHPDGCSAPSDIRNSEGGGSLVEETVVVCFLCAYAGRAAYYVTESELLDHLRQVHEPGNWEDVLRSHGLSQAQLCTGCGLYWMNVGRHRSTCVLAHSADEAASRVAVRQAKKASDVALREAEVVWDPSSQLSSL